MRLTVKERILLHLLESDRFADDLEVFPVVTQEGVAGGAGIERRHLVQFIRPLMEEGLVRERQAHVAGIRQRRKVYALTSQGRTAASRLREKVSDRVIRIRDGDVVRQGRIQEALEGIGTQTTLLEVVRQVEQAGVLNLETVRHPPNSGFIEQMGDAPRVGAFVGRREELAEVLREAELPRVFVIRGIPGIGKTVFAAKVCELLRGKRNLFWHRIRVWESGKTVLAGLGRFLEALDRPALASVLKRGEVAAAAEVLRQDLPDTCAFLVFDDAHEAAQDVLHVLRMLLEAAAAAPDVRILVLARSPLRFYDVRDVALRRLVGEMELGPLSPTDAAALLADGGSATELQRLPHLVSGHPLFLELVRQHRPDHARALQDMRRFLEETTYQDLTDPEREAMMAASLYEVPVPEAAFLSRTESLHKVIASLRERGLLRTVGSDRYETHDIIRDFFQAILSPQERERYGMRAATLLRELAACASASGDWVGTIACLSNALHVATSPVDCVDLYEALGEANHRIGDALAMSVAYQGAMGQTRDRDALARLHRKMASAFEDWGQYTAAATETDAGFAALGDAASVERGWLEMIRARMAAENAGGGDAWDHAEAARQIFCKFRVPAGEAEALVELGTAAALDGRLAPDGTVAFKQCYESALELASSQRNPLLAAKIHLSTAAVIAHGLGEVKEAWAHLRAVKTSTPALADSVIRATFHVTRAWVALTIGADYARAEADLAHAEYIASRIHDAKVHANAIYLLANPARHRGRYAEAAQYLIEAGSETASAGLITFALTSYAQASMHYLAAGDWEGYARTEAVLHAAWPTHGRPDRDLSWRLWHQGLDELIHGNPGGFDARFREFFRLAKEYARWSYAQTGVWWGHFLYAQGLRALGRKQEAAEHLDQAAVLLRSFHNRLGMDLMKSDFGDRLTVTLRGAMTAMTKSAA